ncbi:MAG: Na+/H+ antiporter subunit E [Rhizobiaceae bacterium]|nr:Na+/H+ antiporter subunit E [Rhizobiaceae bacterium]
MKERAVLAVAAVRAVALFAFWLALANWTIADVVAGAVAAGIASWASILLLPPAPHSSRSFLAIAQIALFFLIQSFLAGLDVARRALDPRMPLQPGFVTCPMSLRGAMPRCAFRALMSLQPGSLPVEEQAGGVLLVHCLNKNQPVSQSFAREEMLFAKAFGIETDHG